MSRVVKGTDIRSGLTPLVGTGVPTPALRESASRPSCRRRWRPHEPPPGIPVSGEFNGTVEAWTLKLGKPYHPPWLGSSAHVTKQEASKREAGRDFRAVSEVWISTAARARHCAEARGSHGTATHYLSWLSLFP